MSVNYGAVPEELSQLGTKLSAQVNPINDIVSTVNGALGGTTWTGPARDQFENDWNVTFRGALAKLSTAFDTAGKDCVNRSADLQRVMGAR